MAVLSQAASIGIVQMTAAQHVAAVAGFVNVFRLVVQNIEDTRSVGEPIDPAEIAGWVERLDFLGNTLSTSNDDAINTLRDVGVETILCTGSVVSRPEPLEG